MKILLNFLLLIQVLKNLTEKDAISLTSSMMLTHASSFYHMEVRSLESCLLVDSMLCGMNLNGITIQSGTLFLEAGELKEKIL